MKNIKTFAFLLALITLSSFVFYKNIEWEISQEFLIKFSSSNPTGVFKKFDGSIIFDPNNLENSSFNLVLPVNSINTGNGMKNKHALSEDWFDEKKYPKIEFKSNSIYKVENKYNVEGKMTIHGVTKEMKIPFEFTNNTFISSFKINRIDFNVGTTKGMSANAATELLIDVKVPVNKK